MRLRESIFSLVSPLRRAAAWAVVLAVAWGGQSLAVAQEETPAAEEEEVSPALVEAEKTSPDDDGSADASAEEILRQAADFYAGKDAIQARADFAIETVSNEGEGWLRQKFNLAFQRPDRYARVAWPPMQVPNTTIFDGGYVSEFSVPEFYVQTNIYKDFEEFLDRDALPWDALGFNQLLRDDPVAAFLGEEGEAVLEGREPMREREAIRLSIDRGDQGKLTLWLAADGDPLLLKSRLDLPREGEDSALETEYESWDFSAEAGEKSFALEPPAGAYRVQSAAQARYGENGPHSLQGLPVPIPPKASEQFSGLIKDRIVILPCWTFFGGEPGSEVERNNLEVIRVADRAQRTFQDRGVALLGIHVSGYLTALNTEFHEFGLKFPFIHDVNADFYKAFRLYGLPTTLLLGSDGTIQAVYAGYWEGFEEMLSDDIETLLAGQRLHAPRATPASAAKGEDPSAPVLNPKKK
jgi:hypothetical protein